MALRKQKDPTRVESAKKAWETMRARYPERYGKNKRNNIMHENERVTSKEANGCFNAAKEVVQSRCNGLMEKDH